MVDIFQALLDRFEKNGRIVGPKDVGRTVSPRLHWGGVLIGRQTELDILMDEFRQAGTGEKRVVWVRGDAGVGKTCLIRKTFQDLRPTGHVLMQGKFDQSREVPYQGISACLQELLHGLLGLGEEELAEWKKRIEASRLDVSVLADLAPRMTDLFGARGSPPLTGPEQAMFRLYRNFSLFLQLFGRAGAPLVLFLDDLQWIDPASLNLLEQLILDRERTAMLIIGAYRAGEVKAAHPLNRMIERCRESRIFMREMSLPPLNREETALWIAQITDAAVKEIREPAGWLHAKTGGNPFYLEQFAKDLSESGLIFYDRARNKWDWKTKSIANKPVTENMASWLAERLDTLPSGTLQVMRFAAAMGSSFDSIGLALALEKSGPGIETDLAPAISAGFMVRDGDEAYGTGAEYRFSHDHIRWTVYERLSSADRKRIHHRIGQNLLAGLPPGAREERLFEIADHVNEALDIVTAGEETSALAKLNRTAAGKARRNLAYLAALKYARGRLATHRSGNDAGKSGGHQRDP